MSYKPRPGEWAFPRKQLLWLLGSLAYVAALIIINYNVDIPSGGWYGASGALGLIIGLGAAYFGLAGMLALWEWWRPRRNILWPHKRKVFVEYVQFALQIIEQAHDGIGNRATQTETEDIRLDPETWLGIAKLVYGSKRYREALLATLNMAESRAYKQDTLAPDFRPLNSLLASHLRQSGHFSWQLREIRFVLDRVVLDVDPAICKAAQDMADYLDSDNLSDFEKSAVEFRAAFQNVLAESTTCGK